MKKTIPKTKYSIIAEKIAKGIKSGKYKAGERIPSEKDIIKSENVSSITSRRVLLELESLGLVKRIKGKGTIVLKNTPFQLTRTLGSFSAMRGNFALNLEKDGIVYTSKILEKTLLKGKRSAEIGNKFYEISGKIFKLRILRYGNNNLLKDETIYVNATLCSDIEKLDNYDSVLDEICLRHNIVLESVNRNLYAKVLVEKDEFFENDSPQSLMMLEGVALSATGRVILIETSAYNAEFYNFTIETKS